MRGWRSGVAAASMGRTSQRTPAPDRNTAAEAARLATAERSRPAPSCSSSSSSSCAVPARARVARRSSRRSAGATAPASGRSSAPTACVAGGLLHPQHLARSAPRGACGALLRSGSAAAGAAVASLRVAGGSSQGQSNRLRAPAVKSTLKPRRSSGSSSSTSTRDDVRAARPVAHEPDHRLDHVGLALEHRLDRAVGAVRDPAARPAPLGLLARRVAEEDALHLPVGAHPPADRSPCRYRSQR